VVATGRDSQVRVVENGSRTGREVVENLSFSTTCPDLSRSRGGYRVDRIRTRKVVEKPVRGIYR
jgi:hypothetical protein